MENENDVEALQQNQFVVEEHGSKLGLLDMQPGKLGDTLTSISEQHSSAGLVVLEGPMGKIYLVQNKNLANAILPTHRHMKGGVTRGVSATIVERTGLDGTIAAENGQKHKDLVQTISHAFSYDKIEESTKLYKEIAESLFSGNKIEFTHKDFDVISCKFMLATLGINSLEERYKKAPELMAQIIELGKKRLAFEITAYPIREMQVKYTNKGEEGYKLSKDMDLISRKLLEILSPLEEGSYLKKISQKHNLQKWLIGFTQGAGTMQGLIGTALLESFQNTEVIEKLVSNKKELLNFLLTKSQVPLPFVSYENVTEEELSLHDKAIFDQYGNPIALEAGATIYYNIDYVFKKSGKSSDAFGTGPTRCIADHFVPRVTQILVEEAIETSHRYNLGEGSYVTIGTESYAPMRGAKKAKITLTEVLAEF